LGPAGRIGAGLCFGVFFFFFIIIIFIFIVHINLDIIDASD
jgi:hypothetical protein